MTREPHGFIDGKPCRVCGGDGWVCENHPDEPAFGDCCGGAGMPCGACALPMAAAGLIRRERDEILRLIDDSVERWRPLGGDPVYIEGYEIGVADACGFLAEDIRRGPPYPFKPASGMETRSATDAQRRGPKGDSPTAESGDAQKPSSPRKSNV